MASFLDTCRFIPTAGGTTDWTYSSAVGGYQSPAAAGAVNGALYRYRAESTDLSQWEIGYGTYNTTTNVLTRVAVLYNSSGTGTGAGQSGAGTKISFTATPQVAIVALAEDIGGWTNRRLAKTSAYTVAQADAGSTIALGGSAFFTLTFGAASGYDPNFSVVVLNEDTGRGKTIACNGLSNFILWPGQSCNVFNQNNVWQVNPPQQPWMPATAPTFHVDPAGSNANDGLATGATGAFATLAYAASVAYSYVYTRNVGSITIDGGANTFQEQVQVYYPLNGGGTLIFQNLSWKPINSGYCLQHGDGALVGITNVTFLTTGVTTPAGIFIAHNHGVLDVNTSVTFNLTVGLSGSVFDHDSGGGGGSQININNGFTISGGASNAGFIFKGQQPLMRFNINGTIFFNNTTWGRFFWASQGTSIVFNGNVGFNSAGGGIAVSAGLINQNGIVQNLSGAALPGGAPVPTTGGQYNTSTTA